MELSLWQEYLALLNQLSDTLEKLTETEREKTAAATRSDLEAVDGCMKQEQVLSLTLRGIDQKRDKLLARMNMSGVPLRKIEEYSPDEALMDTKRTAERLRHCYEVFQSASDAARVTLECNLHAIEKLMAAREGQPQPAVPQNEPRQADFRV